MKRFIGVSILILSVLISWFVLSAGESCPDKNIPTNLMGSIPSEKTGLLQFTAPGHVIGFKKGGIVMAAGDHAVQIEFMNSNDVEPVSDATARENGSGVQALEKVVYKNLWDQIDLIYEKTREGVIKSSYVVRPGGATESIRLKYNGQANISNNGELSIKYETGNYIESKPVSWQEAEGQTKPIESNYRKLNKSVVGFSTSGWDEISNLVIDPISMWNFNMGAGSPDGDGKGIIIDNSGNIIITGYSAGTWGSPLQAYGGGTSDCSLIKLDSSGVLQWLTFIGGNAADIGYGITKDSDGSFYVVGKSDATWGVSPLTPFNGGTCDAFVAKLDSNGALIWNTFLGGGASDEGFGIFVDTSKNIFITGYSTLTWGSPKNPFGGAADSFVAKLNSAGALQWNTFLGGGGNDYGQSIAVDGIGNVFLTGYSGVSWGTPIRAHGGATDAYVAKLDAGGVLQWNTFLGGSDGNATYGHGISVDNIGNAYVTGNSSCTWESPINPYSGATLDIFLGKLNSNGSLQWNTFYGEAGGDYAHGITVDNNGNSFITGESSKTWGNPVNPFTGASYNAFVAMFKTNGDLQWNTFMGETAHTVTGNSIALDSNGQIYTVGDNSYLYWDAAVYKLDYHLTISGTITVGGSPLAGVVLNGLPGNPTTNSSGVYSATVDYGWSGTVTPTLAGYTFSPVNRVYANVTADQTAQNYTSAITGIPQSERAALIALYNSTNGDSWTNKTGWKTPPLHTDGFAMPGTEGSWFGVTVTSSHVTYIQLNTNNLVGTIPTQIGNFPNLINLLLAQNQLTGSIPIEVGNLSQLVNLQLYTNQMSGTIPTQLGNLSNLYSLYLNGTNQFTGTIPTELGNLTKLTQLYLNNNLLTGSIPSQLGNLTNLTALVLNNNQLTGSIPNQIGNLTKLVYLHLYTNQLTGAIPVEIGNLTNLTDLRLYSNLLSGGIPITLGNLVNLEYLWLQANQLSGSIPSEIGNLSKLLELYLHTNQLTGTIPESFSNLHNLKVLHLSANPLTGNFPTFLGNMTTLTHLLIHNTEITGSIPMQIGNLTNLVYLYIQANKLSGDIPVELGNLVNLQRLRLYQNQLTGSIPSQLGNLTNLQQLMINENALTGSIPATLANLTLLNPTYTDFGYNANYTSNTDLITFLNSKDPDWASTQTIAPSNITATPVNPTTINLTWDAIAYTGDTGGYRIFVGTTPGGPYTFFQQTTDKSATSLPVTGLNPGTPYYFVITTRTDAHGTQQNIVDSENSAEASASTLPGTYTISGNTGIAGSTLSYTDGSPNTATSDGSGNYSFTVSYNWSGTVTPSLTGYTFTPANRTYTNVLSNQTSQDYTATPINYTISGNAGAVGVTLSYTDGSPKTATSDGSGNYSFTVSYNWSGTVTPSLAGYTFTPANRTYTNTLSNQTSQDYTATAIRYNISGNAGIAGATLSYTDGTPKTATSDGGGNYSFTVSYNWSGTVTPSLTGYNFSPTNRIYTNVLSNQTSQDYSATLITFTVTFIEGTGGTITGTKVQTVNYGANASEVTAVANIGYHFVNWTGSYSGTDNPLTITNVTADMSITANYAINQYTVTFIEGVGGTITGTKVQTIDHGGSTSEVQSVPDSGYHFIDWSGDFNGTDNPLTISNVTADMTITANFACNIPQSERAALIALFNATGGASWISKSGWQDAPLHSDGFAMPGTEGDWFGVTASSCHVIQVILPANNLSGSLPTELGDLAQLQVLHLEGNKISGQVPSVIGNLTSLTSLHLQNNKLIGSLPASLVNLTILSDTDIGYNGLYANDSGLLDFLNGKDADWAATQTIFPANFLATPVNSTTINLTWDQIQYNGDTGGYRISVGTTSGGPYSFFQQTTNKTITSLPVTGLNPGTQYYFVIQTRTDPHGDQLNTVDSENSAEASAITIQVHTVTFLAGSNGTLSGTTTQVVEHGSSCSSVTANADAGYHFVNWTGTGGFTSTENPLTVTNVTEGMTITANFLITDTLLVLSPNGGENWNAGDSHDITWTSSGTIASVNIDYSTNNGANWTSIASNTDNDGTYSWTIPNTPSTSCLVRIYDVSDFIPSDSSNAVFTITEPIETVSAPDTPTGPSTGTISTSYDYSTGGSTSNLGHSLQYKFDWDDGSDSGWLATGTTSASHSWATAGTYDVRAMARCATHTTVESLWSDELTVTISDGGSGAHYNSPAERLILPEVNWASASGGGDWVSEVQITDVSGGSIIQVYYNSGTNRRGPFTLWSNGGGAAGSSLSWGNMLQTIDALDAGTFAYYGTGGSLEMVTQDSSHTIQAAIRSYNGNFSRTFPALADVETNTAASGRTMVVPNMSMDTAFRPSLVLFNPSSDSVTAEVQIVGSNGSPVGAPIAKTVAPYEMTGVAGLRVETYSNADFWVTVTGGSGRLIVSGQSANNVSNDPAAHVAVQTGPGYATSPAERLIFPEVNWASASGGGDWVSELHITDLSGGAVVQVYYNSGTNRRGPFTLWTNSGGANRSVTFSNILQAIDGLDGGAFTYYGTGGALELVTQDGSHLIQAALKGYNGNVTRTFPAFQDSEANTAALGRDLLIPNLSMNTAFRPSLAMFNPSADSVTMEVRIIGNNGSQIGSTITKTLAGYEMAGVVGLRVETYSNACIRITVTGGSGRVIASGQSAHNVSNDPAAHIAVQGQ